MSFRSPRSAVMASKEGVPLLAHAAKRPRTPAAHGAVGNADAIRGAPDTAVARDSTCEELCQRRGRDDDALGRRDLAPGHAVTRGGSRLASDGGTEKGTEPAFAGSAWEEVEPAPEDSAAGPCGSSIGGSPSSNGILPFSSLRRAWRSHL
jgi:hypothetical protein